MMKSVLFQQQVLLLLWVIFCFKKNLIHTQNNCLDMNLDFFNNNKTYFLGTLPSKHKIITLFQFWVHKLY